MVQDGLSKSSVSPVYLSTECPLSAVCRVFIVDGCKIPHVSFQLVCEAWLLKIHCCPAALWCAHAKRRPQTPATPAMHHKGGRRLVASAWPL